MLVLYRYVDYIYIYIYREREREREREKERLYGAYIGICRLV